MVKKERVLQCNSVAHWSVFNHLWTTMELCAQRNKIYQALDTHSIIVSRIHSLLVLVFSFNLFP